MSDQQISVITLPETFTQPELDEIKADVDKQLAEKPSLQLDCTAVGNFDSAALQFLIVFANSSFAAIPSVVNASSAMLEALADIGVPNEVLKKHFVSVEDGSEKAA
ncbi:MAG: hypothetical protein AB8B84_11730 [Granulosicoccus sp.]